VGVNLYSKERSENDEMIPAPAREVSDVRKHASHFRITAIV
jgi:hypothetical protein